jgi:hypothetical protein
MPTENEVKLLAVLERLFPLGTTLRFLETTEPGRKGEEFNRVRIDYAKDSLNLRIPCAFVEEHRDCTASRRAELEAGLTEFVVDKLSTFERNPGPRLRSVIAWTFAPTTEIEPASLG